MDSGMNSSLVPNSGQVNPALGYPVARARESDVTLALGAFDGRNRCAPLAMLALTLLLFVTFRDVCSRKKQCGPYHDHNQNT